MSGWIKIHRSITEHWLYAEKRVFSKFEAWHDILLTVNYSESKCLIKGKLYTVKRGQSILSLESWANRWNWDKSKVRRFMGLLKQDGMIDLISDSITTHLTVCKYDAYQDERNANETQTKLKRISNEFQTTPIEEGKEYKEGKESKEILFGTFWDLYDKKTGKKECMEKWGKLSNDVQEKILLHVPKYVKSTPDAKFRKDPIRYLTKQLWLDDVSVKDEPRKETWQEIQARITAQAEQQYQRHGK
jgi:hypothetical protein